ncbi:MAG: Fic family protein [Actinomycetia bacterium]|nr:Fic family protein [Actinomycetes bacterium]
MRAGTYVLQPAGYRAFIPKDLPPDPPIEMDGELIRLVSQAQGSLCRLDGVASVLPNADLFVAMYVRQEAVLSSQIEGIQSSLEDVLEFEAVGGRQTPKDVEEVVNYVKAMNHGLARLAELPLSLRLLREIHALLLEGVRGNQKTPGEFRRSQNWVGPAGAGLANAAFVPPPVHEMRQALGNLERFLHDKTLPDLVNCGLSHAQFETIHPFLDGNGRIGRLLITFQLCEGNVLEKPLLYLSHYFKHHRAEYYDRLSAIRDSGDWEGWLKFFLQGVHDVSQSATSTARAVLALQEKAQEIISGRKSRSTISFRLLDYLFEHPIVTVNMVSDQLKCSYLTASNAIDEFVNVDLLREVTGQKRNRRFSFDSYLGLFT